MKDPIRTPPSSPLDPKLFRRAMGCFTTGVTIVTTESDGEPYGMTVNAFTSVSLQPPLVMVCLADSARTTAAVQSRGWFAVNVLERGQEELSNRFAELENDRFAGVEFSLDDHDLPILAGCIAHLVCRVHRIDPGGDHQMILGEVVRVAIHDAAPLVFFRGFYGGLAGTE